MQASKIEPGSVYAVNSDNELVRFHVTSVTTVRSKATGSPHDYRSTVSGYYVEDGAPEPNESIKLDPKKILGPFEDFIELVERKRREDAARKAAADAKDEQIRDFARLLYRVTGQPVPEKVNGYTDMFRASFNKVEISEEGQALLRAVLEKLPSHAV